MAITNASRLADFGTGIGTAGAVIDIDNANAQVGLGTTNPNSTVTVGPVGASGTSLFVHGDGRVTGVLTAGNFSGDLTGAVTSSGALSVTDTTASTSTTTGALKVSGGIGVAKSIFVGEGISIAGTITYNDVTNIDSIGFVTAGKGLRATTGGLIVTAGVSTFGADIGGKDGVQGLNVATALKVAGVSTFVGLVTCADVVSSGIITADSYYGDGSNLSNITSTTINNNADNRLITGSGTANTLEGESKLTFDSTTTQLKITRDDDSNSGLYVFHNDGSECARLVQKGTGHEGTLVLRDGGTANIILDGETGSISYINGGGGLAIGTNALVSGRPDNVLHLHKSSGGTADGPTIWFTNSNTGVSGSDGFTVGLNDTQSPYLWNRENTDLRFGTNNNHRMTLDNDGNLRLLATNNQFSTAHYQCTPTISSNYTVTTTYNEMMIGPITINNGVTLAVNTGARLVVL